MKGTFLTLHNEFVLEFQNFMLSRILVYCVGMRAERSLLHTTVREGALIFTAFG